MMIARSKTLVYVGAAAALFAVGVSLGAAAPQDVNGANREQTHYIVKALSTVGGTQSVGEAITERGWISGAANLNGDPTQHAALWRDLRITDLGTLGGPSSRVVGGVKDEHGSAHTDGIRLDPNFARAFAGRS